MGLCLGLAPAPAPRPRARPRVMGSPAEQLIRRGGWKRRGIVFVDESAMLADEEETFEI